MGQIAWGCQSAPDQSGKGASMFKSLAAAGAVLMVSGCAMVAQTSAPPPGLSWYVISELNDFYDDPEDPTNRPPLVTQPPAGVVRAVDINADGVNDWLVEWPDSTQFCGTGGCRFTVYLTHGQNLVRIFDRQTFQPLDISMVDGEPRLEGSFHHGSCNEQRDDCRLAWGLDADDAQAGPAPLGQRRHLCGPARRRADRRDLERRELIAPEARESRTDRPEPLDQNGINRHKRQLLLDWLCGKPQTQFAGTT